MKGIFKDYNGLMHNVSVNCAPLLNGPTENAPSHLNYREYGFDLAGGNGTWLSDDPNRPVRVRTGEEEGNDDSEDSVPPVKERWVKLEKRCVIKRRNRDGGSKAKITGVQLVASALRESTNITLAEGFEDEFEKGLLSMKRQKRYNEWPKSSLLTSACPLVFFKLSATLLGKNRPDATGTGVAECEGLSFREKGDTSEEVELAPLGGTAGFGIACFTSSLLDRTASLICNRERTIHKGSISQQHIENF
ncbi:hypothetical protein Cgig2_009925 [Carnegiea gigantea]|uniref:Uncharacterized protein n=1 Tax=Carnegiea gigantea TaxID=171969 RepID=A0A9Q1K4P1_9CARY|nr:hypothetical protein Cgig2_009925 [Carnegiea gigantea]